MTRTFTLLFLFFIAFTNAQDTIYLDQDFKETIADNAAFYRIEQRNSMGDPDVIKSTYRIDGQITRQDLLLKRKRI